MTISFGSNKLIQGADMSASFQSDNINLHRKEEFAIHSIFTGSPVGSMYLAVSLDAVSWIILQDSTAAIAAAGDVMYNVNVAGYLWARLHYVATSGTGSLSAFFNAKGEI